MLRDAAEDLLAFSTFPIAHWRKIWSTNPLERINGEMGKIGEPVLTVEEVPIAITA